MKNFIKVFLLVVLLLGIVLFVVFHLMWRGGGYKNKNINETGRPVAPLETSGFQEVAPDSLPSEFGRDFPKPPVKEGFKAQVEELSGLKQYTWFFKSNGTELQLYREFLSKNGFSEVNSYVTESLSVLQYRKGEAMVRIEISANALTKESAGQIIFLTNKLEMK